MLGNGHSSKRFYNFFSTSLHLSASYADMLRYVMPAAFHSTADSSPLRDEPSLVTKHNGSGIRASDPLQASFPMPFQHVLFPFGFSVQIKSNEAGIVRLAEHSWGTFKQRFRDTPIEVRFLVSDFLARRRAPLPAFRAQSNLLTIVADAHNFACCDLATGFGFASVTRGTMMNRDYIRYHFLEAMVYTLLDTQHLVALHAACLAKHGRGFLFVGRSGAGKSSLAYACMRRGWTYISDDASSLLRRRSGRTVVGNPYSFRFRPSASVLFPELQGQIKLRNGKPTVEIRTEHLRESKTTRECTVDYVVFLNRRDDDSEPPRLSPVTREDGLRRLFQENVWPPELPRHEERVDAIERLLDAQLFELTYKAFDPAIGLLEQTLRRGEA